MRNFGQIRLSLSNFGQFRLSLGNFGQFRLSLSNFGQFRLYLNTCSNDNFRNFLSLKTCVTVDNLGSKFNINVLIILMNCKDSHAGIIAGVIVSVFVVFVKGVGILLVVVKKGMLKSSIGAVNHNKKQEEEEVGLPPSSDRKGGNTNNYPPLSSLMVNDNNVSPTYNDYVVYALPTCDKVMHKYSL